MQYSIAFCSQVEAAIDVISSEFVMMIVPDKAVKFRDLGLNSSRKFRPKAIGDDICGCLFYDNCRPEVYVDVISGVVVQWVSVDVLVKFGDSRSNRS